MSTTKLGIRTTFVQTTESDRIRCAVVSVEECAPSEPIGVNYDQMFLGEETYQISRLAALSAISNLTGFIETKLSGGKVLEKKLKLVSLNKPLRVGCLAKKPRCIQQKHDYIWRTSTQPAEFAGKHHRRWLVSFFEAGDVVLHDPFTIHVSTVNTDPESTIRLSTDLRFYDASRAYDQ
ncbi:hypothetical protein N7474_002299, partial [Penicillium riverlandense]|uniref:uncharacterized protein n=1 Tax=Penicillium riverlandense TaxID=1903569 RepID=UPI002549777A